MKTDDETFQPFSLLNLFLAVIIVGVLVSVAAARYYLMSEKFRAREAIADMRNIYSRIDDCHKEGREFRTCTDVLNEKADFPPSPYFDYAAGVTGYGKPFVVAIRNTKSFNYERGSLREHRIELKSLLSSNQTFVKGYGVYRGIEGL